MPSRRPHSGDLGRVAGGLADRVVEVPAGPWQPDGVAPPAGAFAVLVLEGLLVREIRVDSVAAAQLVLAGDVLEPTVPGGSTLSGLPVSWRALQPARLAVLGLRFLDATRRRPGLSVLLQRRNAEQAARAAEHAAIGHLPRVEDRILALFRSVAASTGTAAPGGTRIDVQLTHEAIGRLVGARRPTVSLALKALADDGLLRRDGRGLWVAAARAPEHAPVPVEAA